jgi:hypothetical protein
MHDTGGGSTFPLVRSLGLRAHTACPAEFTLNHVKKLLSYPTWNGFLKLVSYTRSYSDGLRIAALLLDYIEQHHALLTPKDVAAFEPLLYHFGLSMLDKLDEWDEYLQAWDWIRQNTNYSSTYSKRSPPSRFGTFLIGEDVRFFHVHFLYGVSHRRVHIENKLARSQRGGRTKNLLHQQQSELTREEIQERFDWMLKFLKTGRYDFKPPASRQRAERMKRRNTVGHEG